VAFALAVKGLFVVLAVAGFSPSWLVILADTGASLAVVANGLRLLRSD
jgi:Zn2+/Cd2+-exporting ATPase